MSDSFQDALKLREILAGTRAQSVKQLSWTALGYNSELIPVRSLEVDGAIRKGSCHNARSINKRAVPKRPTDDCNKVW